MNAQALSKNADVHFLQTPKRSKLCVTSSVTSKSFMLYFALKSWVVVFLLLIMSTNFLLLESGKNFFKFGKLDESLTLFFLSFALLPSL